MRARDIAGVRVRHGIVAALRERPAAAEALKREDDAAARAVAGDGFLSIDGTGGMEFTGAADERAEEDLVEANEGKQQPCAGLHAGSAIRYLGVCGRSFSSSSVSSVKFAVAAAARG